MISPTRVIQLLIITCLLVGIECRPIQENDTSVDYLGHSRILFPHDEKNDTAEKRYFGFVPGFSYKGGGGGGHTDGHGHLGDVDAIAGHEGFHASQHPHHDDHHHEHHDEHHHAPAYGHAGGDSDDDYGTDGIEHHRDSEPNTMMAHTGPGVHFHTGMIHMDEGGHLSRSGHEEGNMFNGIDSIGAHGGHGGESHGGEDEEEEHQEHHEEEPHEDHDDHNQLMSIPIAPLPHGYHQGLGPNGESEDHDDEEEELHHEEKDHRQHQYNMDRGGPAEHHMLEADKGHHDVHQGFRHLHARERHHAPLHEHHHHREHFHEHEHSGDYEEPWMDDELEWDEDEFMMDKKKAHGHGGHGGGAKAKAHGGGGAKAKAHAGGGGGAKVVKGHGAIIKSNGAVVAGVGGVKVHLAAGHIGTLATSTLPCGKVKAAAAACKGKKGKATLGSVKLVDDAKDKAKETDAAAKETAAAGGGGGASKEKTAAKAKDDLKKEIAEAVAKETKKLKEEAAAKEKARLKAVEEANKLKELANQERIKKLEQQNTETTEALKEVAAKVQDDKGKASSNSNDSPDSKKPSNTSAEASPANVTLPETNVKISVDNSGDKGKQPPSDNHVELNQKESPNLQIHEPEIASHNQDLLDPNPPNQLVNDARAGNEGQPAVVPQEHPPNNNQNDDHDMLPFPNSQAGLPPSMQPHFQSPTDIEQREHDARLPSQTNIGQRHEENMSDREKQFNDSNQPNSGRNFENENHNRGQDNGFVEHQSDRGRQNFNQNNEMNSNDHQMNERGSNEFNPHDNADSFHGNTNTNNMQNEHLNDHFHDNNNDNNFNENTGHEINNGNDNRHFHGNDDNQNFDSRSNNDMHFPDNNGNGNNNVDNNNFNRGGVSSEETHSMDITFHNHESDGNRHSGSGIDNGPFGENNRHQLRDSPSFANQDHSSNSFNDNGHYNDGSHGNNNYQSNNPNYMSHGEENGRASSSFHENFSSENSRDINGNRHVDNNSPRDTNGNQRFGNDNPRVTNGNQHFENDNSRENNGNQHFDSDNSRDTNENQRFDNNNSRDINENQHFDSDNSHDSYNNQHFDPPTNPRPSPAQVQQQIPEKDHLHGETNHNIHSSFVDNHGNNDDTHNGPYTEEVGLQNSNDPILKKIREELKSGGNDMEGGNNVNEKEGTNNRINNDNGGPDSNKNNAHPGAGTMQDLEALMPGNDQNQVSHKSLHPCIECRHEEKAKTRTDVHNARPGYDLIFVKMKTDQNKSFNNNYLRRRDKIIDKNSDYGKS